MYNIGLNIPYKLTYSRVVIVYILIVSGIYRRKCTIPDTYIKYIIISNLYRDKA
jgi:hypothetical protein